MTREEAVKQLTINRPSTYTELREAIDMAIEALKPKPMQKFDNVKQHIDRLAGDYKCWDERLSHEEALELSRMLEKEPCEDCVSREAVKDILHKSKQKAVITFEDFEELVNKLPSVAPQQKMGKWIAVENEEMETVGYYCSECDLPMETEYRTKFCPNCGKKMEVNKNEQNNKKH